MERVDLREQESGEEAEPPEQRKPAYREQFESHPSPSNRLPSSQLWRLETLIPSPHVS